MKKEKNRLQHADLVGSGQLYRSRCRHGQSGGKWSEVVRKSSDLDDEGLQMDSSHDFAPGCIHLPEGAAFLGYLLHDFLRAEDGLQV